MEFVVLFRVRITFKLGTGSCLLSRTELFTKLGVPAGRRVGQWFGALRHGRDLWRRFFSPRFETFCFFSGRPFSFSFFFFTGFGVSLGGR